MAIVRYTQVEAIYEAMRELGSPLKDDLDRMIYEAEDVEACLSKIRAALAGEIQTSSADAVTWTRSQTHFDVRGGVAVPCEEEADERMVRPEDVAPPVVERSDEDSKTTWQG